MCQVFGIPWTTPRALMVMPPSLPDGRFRRAVPRQCTGHTPTAYPANLAGVPRLASSRSAVSGLMPRRAAKMSWMRCGGTRSFKAKALAERPRAASSSRNTAPGWTCSNANWGTEISSTIIDDLDVLGVAVPKTEYKPPRSVYRHRPLALSIARQTVRTARLERRNIFDRPRRSQDLQACHRFGDIHAAKSRFAVLRETRGRAIGEADDHQTAYATHCMTRQACYRDW